MKMEITLKNGKVVKIPYDKIENLMEKLDLSPDQAIDLWLTDEGYIKNEEVERLTKKAKENKADKIVVRSKVETLTKKAKESGADKIVNKAKTTRAKSERKPKENPLKTSILDCLHKALIDNSEMLNISPIVQTSKGIDLYINEKYFTITLTEHRPPKAKSE